MDARTKEQLLAGFTKWRTGKGFLLSLSVFVGIWVTFDYLFYKFDPELLRLNLVLSIEAAYALPVLMMQRERQEAAEAKQLKYMKDLIETTLELVQELAKQNEGVSHELGATAIVTSRSVMDKGNAKR